MWWCSISARSSPKACRRKSSPIRRCRKPISGASNDGDARSEKPVGFLWQADRREGRRSFAVEEGKIVTIIGPNGVGPASLKLERVFYLDSVGMLASFANRAFLKSSQPTPGQIATWDRFMVPVSKLLDPCLGRRLGKSVIAVWQR